MKYWRMAFKWGQQGEDGWPICHKKGIAAIGYSKLFDKDCSKLTEEEYDQIWSKIKESKPSSQSSLRRVAYHMKKGDVIYVKDGTLIVGKGRIAVGKGERTRAYRYSRDVLKGVKHFCTWHHFVKVDWEENFSEFRIDLGANQHTVLPLDERKNRLNKILNAESKARKSARKRKLREFHDIDIKEAEEGSEYTKEITFRERNRALVEQKKTISDYSCDVCAMNFKKCYGKIGEGYIIAHHIEPLADRKTSSKTTLNDLVLVCANCHAMLHREKPPMHIKKLKRIYSSRRK